MTEAGVYEFIATRKLAVVSSVGPDGAPQSALVGFALTPDREIVFDTLEHSRKGCNLIREPQCSLVICCSGEVTVQIEGFAAQHRVDEEGGWKQAYFRAWPDGPARLNWPGLTYFLVSPTWIRYSDFGQSPPEIVEFRPASL
jgi:pyridoxine/pyridoxamine 5'-phosphate oxidase